MSITCKVCSTDFSPSHPFHKGGHYSVCGDCENKREINKDVIKTIGMLVSTGKTDQFTQIIRNPSNELKQWVKRQGMCGPSHCFTSLGLNSSGATTSKQNIDKVQTKLYEGID